jgi:hypothetical protein
VSAIISPCGTYRYVLHRSIPQPIRWVRRVVFVMLNPSTADATVDDPTIRSCIRFAQRWGYTRLTVVNLFALRATDPAELARNSDPVGPENDRHIDEQLCGEFTEAIVAAWGAHHFAADRAREVIARFGPFQCLGVTKGGSPRHPLYLPAATELRPLE